ncbi:MAG: hypothetical protein ACU0DK_00225 [Pseudooceanicola sp.]
MSDPVTNVQIEDVLSSIRKLVSEEVRSQTQSARMDAEPDVGADEPATSGMLVLTPAHRVRDDESQSEEDELAALEAAAFEADEEGPAEADEDDGGFDIDAFSRELLEEGDEDPLVFATAADDGERDDFFDAPQEEDLPALGDLGDYEDEGENAAAPVSVSPFSTQRRKPDTPDFSDLPEQEELDTGMAEDESIEDADDEPTRDSATIPSFLRSRGVSSLDDRLADLDEVVTSAEAALDTETDAAESGDADAIAWEDHLSDPSTDLLDAPQDDPEQEIDGRSGWEDDEAEDAAAFNEIDPQMIDEEMLRDLVSEIVREELQGALGERITRNVRKLVRREIQRALTAHDLL